jgi:hypothetical protein
MNGSKPLALPQKLVAFAKKQREALYHTIGAMPPAKHPKPVTPVDSQKASRFPTHQENGQHSKQSMLLQKA